MESNVFDNFFLKAQPIWAKGLTEEKNITLGLYKKISYEKGKAVLRVAVSGFYKVFLNGEFLYFGPVRCAHGYYRVDEIELPLKKGENHIAIETVNYYVNSFYSLMQKGFIEAELTADGEVLAATGAADDKAFEMLQLNERIRRVQRYSYQRPFAEAYNLSEDYCGWRVGENGENALEVETVITESKRLLPRNIPLNKFPKAFPDFKVGEGTVKTGVKPDNYRKDRSLIYIKDPASGNLEGYFENELNVHLSDEAQEMPTVTLKTENAKYGGKTRLNSNEFEMLSFPCEKTGFITADINCLSNSTLYFLFDEILTESGDIDPLRLDCCNVIKINLKRGVYRFMSAEPYGFKYIKLICLGGELEINNLSITQTVCSVPITFDFKSGDERLNKILAAAKETFIQNSFDIFTDCPTRERAGWLCDSFFLGRAERTFTGKNLIERNFLENFLLPEGFQNIPEGMLPMCYPADVDGGGFIPNWAMWFILELKDYKERTGEGEFVSLFKNRVYRLLDWFKKYENNDGLLEKLPGWVFVEWSKANDFVKDVNFPTNMLYSSALYAAGELFGDKELTEKAEKLKITVRERSFDGEFFRDNEVYENGKLISTANRTETCQYYAFFTGVATKELYPELWKILSTEFGPDRVKNGVYPEIHTSNAFIGNFLRLELLCRNGDYSKLLEEIKGYFLYMAERTGTLWEHKDTCASCNHGFASYAAELIYKAEHNNN
ncbi:MAG: hypothetical protein ACI4F7_03110 [Acutalibacteraceae bacterium]